MKSRAPSPGPATVTLLLTCATIALTWLSPSSRHFRPAPLTHGPTLWCLWGGQTGSRQGLKRCQHHSLGQKEPRVFKEWVLQTSADCCSWCRERGAGPGEVGGEVGEVEASYLGPREEAPIGT